MPVVCVLCNKQVHATQFVAANRILNGFNTDTIMKLYTNSSSIRIVHTRNGMLWKIGRFSIKHEHSPWGGHRENLPAHYTTYGTLFYMKKGEWHREDGPAIVRLSGKNKWYINGLDQNKP